MSSFITKQINSDDVNVKKMGRHKCWIKTCYLKTRSAANANNNYILKNDVNK